MDDVLDLPRRAVTLALDDLSGEDDVFKVEDREVVIARLRQLIRTLSDDT